MSKKGVTQISNKDLFHCPEAPGQPPSRARFLKKKQHSESISESFSWNWSFLNPFLGNGSFFDDPFLGNGSFFPNAYDLTRPGQGPANSPNSANCRDAYGVAKGP